MAQRLPPLNALRAFEAAARHLSFTKAAEELHVTQAAISHQIKGLEETLGIQLFRRLNRRLLLTEAGQAYLPPLTDVFEQIGAATRRLYQGEETGTLKVSVLPSFAAAWLLPRLLAFRERCPAIDVLVSASDALTDFNRDDIDLGVRFGLGKYPGLRIDRMFGEEIFVICSPALLTGDRPLKTPADLKHHTLLHDEVARNDDSPDWRIWLREAGVTDVDPDRGPGYSHSSLVMQAAVKGQGVALGRSSLAADDLAAGTLVMPFGPVLRSNHAYYVVSPESTADRPKVRLFREWLLETAINDPLPDLSSQHPVKEDWKR